MWLPPARKDTKNGNSPWEASDPPTMRPEPETSLSSSVSLSLRRARGAAGSIRAARAINGDATSKAREASNMAATEAEERPPISARCDPL